MKDFLLRRSAGQAGSLEALEGAGLLSAATPASRETEEVIARQRDEFVRTGDAETLLSDELAAAMAACGPRHDLTQSAALPLSVDRTAMIRPPLGQAALGMETWPYPE